MRPRGRDNPPPARPATPRWTALLRLPRSAFPALQLRDGTGAGLTRRQVDMASRLAGRCLPLRAASPPDTFRTRRSRGREGRAGQTRTPVEQRVLNLG